MIVKPAQQDLLGWQAQKLFERLVILQQAVEFGVEFDINLAQETAPNDLPDEPENEMLADFDDVAASNVDDGTANALGRVDDDVVILGHVEGIQRLELFAGLVQDALIDGIGDAVIDQLGQHQAILTLVKHLKGVGGEGQRIADVRVAGKDRIDVPGKLGALILIDRVGDVGGGALDMDGLAYAALGGMMRARDMSLGRGNVDGGWLGMRRGRTQLGDELHTCGEPVSLYAVALMDGWMDWGGPTST